MILSWSCISLSCLSRSVISLSWPSIGVLPTFHKLFDVTTVSRVISLLYFIMSSFAFFVMVLHISAYYIRCLSSPFSIFTRRFAIRDRTWWRYTGLQWLLIALYTFDTLCWIMPVMVSLMGSMSSSSWSVWNRFIISSWNSIFFDPFVQYLLSWPFQTCRMIRITCVRYGFWRLFKWYSHTPFWYGF